MTHPLETRLRAGLPLLNRQIQQLFNCKNDWTTDCSLPLAWEALRQGENFLAYDIAETAPGIPRGEGGRLHIMALALARSGSLERARQLLAQLPQEDSSEITGLKCRILKDMAVNSANADQKKDLFLQAAQISLQIFKSQRQFYNGINAASCLLMAGCTQEAQALVRQNVLPLAVASAGQELWAMATRAECHLVLGDITQATRLYEQAAEIAGATGRLGDFSSTLRQLKMLCAAIGRPAELILCQLDLPAIAAFSGHLIDQPGRAVPRFPAAAEEQVRQELAEIIRVRHVQKAFASCACGGDIIFLEELLKQGGECVVVPPMPMAATRRNCVDIIPGHNWHRRLEAILENERAIMMDPECDELGDDSDDLVYDFTNRYILGLAKLKAQILGFPLVGIAVWNGLPSGRIGGTDSAVALWKRAGIPVHIVTPEVRHG